MVKVEKGDFIQVDFVGRLKENNKIFDLTDEELAKQDNIHNPRANYGPLVICIGHGQLLKGLEEELIGKEIGKEYKIELKAEKAFGNKNAKLIKVVPSTKFRKEKLNPFPGLHVNVDGLLATVKSVSSGRVILDFNHPLAGKDVVYEVKLIKKITSLDEQVKSIVQLVLGIKDFEVEIKDKKVNLKIKEKLPKEAVKAIEEHIKRLVKADEVMIAVE